MKLNCSVLGSDLQNNGSNFTNDIKSNVENVAIEIQRDSSLVPVIDINSSLKSDDTEKPSYNTNEV